MKYYVCILMFLIMMGSCNGNNKDFTRNTLQEFQEKEIIFPPELKHCVIIPGGGCAGCIASGINFILANNSCFSCEQNENMVVFTNINSLKLLKRNLGKHKIEEFFNILDYDNNYYIEGPESIYPIIIYLNRGVIKHVDVQSPYNDAFKLLEKDI